MPRWPWNGEGLMFIAVTVELYMESELSDTILSTTRTPPLTVPEKQGKSGNWRV